MNNIRGFTLVEVIMTLGILVAVLTMAIPDISGLFTQQKEKIDELNIADINRALSAYAKDNKRLPDPDPAVDDPDWADELAKYSKLSADEMRTDPFGTERIYEMYEDTSQGYRQGDLNIFYATVLSLGKNKENESYVEGEGSDANPVQTWSDATALANLDEKQAFQNYRPEGDDLVARFSDFNLKTELYELRLERMGQIVQAIEAYAADLYNKADQAAQAACSTSDCGLPARIYYPRSGDPVLQDETDTDVPEDQVYSQYNLDEMTNIIGKTSLTPGDLNDMNLLMRLLNLPEYYALDPVTNQPFYYYSNPNPGNLCDEGRVQAPFMPLVLSVVAPCTATW